MFQDIWPYLGQRSWTDEHNPWLPPNLACQNMSYAIWIATIQVRYVHFVWNVNLCTYCLVTCINYICLVVGWFWLYFDEFTNTRQQNYNTLCVTKWLTINVWALAIVRNAFTCFHFCKCNNWFYATCAFISLWRRTRTRMAGEEFGWSAWSLRGFTLPW